MPILIQIGGAIAASIGLTYLIGDGDDSTPLDTLKSQITIQNVAAGLGILAAGVTIYKFYKGK